MLLQQRRQLRKRAHCIVDKYYLCSHMPQSNVQELRLILTLLLLHFIAIPYAHVQFIRSAVYLRGTFEISRHE